MQQPQALGQQVGDFLQPAPRKISRTVALEQRQREEIAFERGAHGFAEKMQLVERGTVRVRRGKLVAPPQHEPPPGENGQYRFQRERRVVLAAQEQFRLRQHHQAADGGGDATRFETRVM